MSKKLTQDQLKQVLDSISKQAPEFARKVQPIFKMLDWKWASATPGNNGIPTIEDIERCIYDLCRDSRATDDGDCKCSTGGIVVEVKDVDGKVFEARLALEIDLTCYFANDDNLRDLEFS